MAFTAPHLTPYLLATNGHLGPELTFPWGHAARPMLPAQVTSSGRRLSSASWAGDPDGHLHVLGCPGALCPSTVHCCLVQREMGRAW